ncbi:MAG: hypothetical protein Terrestrivirus5_94 [Terrestrivirus sp.]|uniref:ABC1 atypical kinase-like domain-containing protein n=1 Tax=Terrestrivirus sp. TaxID=2487775 RepID=A0A3G4ZN37_9VIRU|nr:MAG: hypothetical protein Terrestrivirus5_94 [Terrestrivirus sp.]
MFRLLNTVTRFPKPFMVRSILNLQRRTLSGNISSGNISSGNAPIQTNKSTNKYANTIRINRKILYGCIGLGIATGSTIAWYYLKDPEKTLTTQLKKSFDEEYSYVAKLAMYARVPEPKFSLDFDNNNNFNTNTPFTIDKWVNIVNDISQKFENGLWNKTVIYMRNSLLEYIDEIPDLRMRLQGYRKIHSDSLELSVILEEQLENEMKKTGWISADILNENILTSRSPSSNEVKLLQLAIMSFPGPVDHLFEYLIGNIDINKMMSFINIDDSDKKEDIKNMENNLIKNLIKIKTQFDTLHPKIQKYMLENVMAKLLTIVKNENEGGANFVNILQKHLLTKLSDNKDIESLIDQLVKIFEALPPNIQSKMMLTALKKKNCDNNINGNYEDIKFLKDLINDAGIVAIKLGQILSEEPKMPQKYRDIFSNLRDDNEPIGLLQYWESILPSMRNNINSLGVLLGVGSVKQVQLIKLKDDNKIMAIAVIKKGSEDDVVSALDALSTIKEIKGIVSRIRKMVFKELDLWMEYESFEQLRRSQYGKQDFITIPHISSVSLNCLIRDAIYGKTLSKLLKSENSEEINKSLERLHRIAIRTAFEEGFIMSDMHLGNMIYVNTGGGKLVLFDPGQNDQITQKEATTLLWTLAALTSDVRILQLKNKVMTELVSVAYSNDHDKEKILLILQECYDGCKQISEPKKRFTQLISSAENKGVILPSGFFACAKMLDTLLSQEKTFNISGVVEEEIAILLKQRIGWIDTINIGIDMFKSNL